MPSTGWSKVHILAQFALIYGITKVIEHTSLNVGVTDVLLTHSCARYTRISLRISTNSGDLSRAVYEGLGPFNSTLCKIPIYKYMFKRSERNKTSFEKVPLLKIVLAPSSIIIDQS